MNVREREKQRERMDEREPNDIKKKTTTTTTKERERRGGVNALTLRNLIYIIHNEREHIIGLSSRRKKVKNATVLLLKI